MPPPIEYLTLLNEIHTSGWFSNFGPLVRRFESQLAEMFGAPEESCITCCNATAGLSAALLANGRPGPVLLPAFTFPASLAAVRAAGMTAIVVDVDPDSWTLTADVLDRALLKTGASTAMFVSPFGIAKNWEAEMAVCHKRDIAVVIDSASGLGALRPSQGFGENGFEVFSMHATKPFAVGEGGAIFAHRIHDAATRSALSFGLNSYATPRGPAWGFNGKMSEFHAAVGIAQLKRFPDVVARRQMFAAVYRDRLARYPEVVCHQDTNSAPWQFFPVLLPSAAAAEKFIETAAAVGVEIRRYYRPSLSRWPGVRCFETCPVAEDLANRMCVLPVRGQNFGAENEQMVGLVLGALERALCGP